MPTSYSFPEDLLQSYNDGRLLNVRRKLCHAPFQNLYFGRDGKVTACCYNRTSVLGTYPEQSLKEICSGEKIKILQAEMTANSFGTGCDFCTEQLEAGNIGGLHAKLYDRFADAPLSGVYQKAAGMVKSGRALNNLTQEWKYLKSKIGKMLTKPAFAMWVARITVQEISRTVRRFYPKKGATEVINRKASFEYPRAMEFELSNICNLECAMCSGEFSSSIRKNREGFPALPMCYDASFVEQLEDFLPHLWVAKFYGGEPFLVPIYYEIWEKMIQINPSTSIHITTNGTILNEKVKRVLKKLNVILILSIDSFVKETYEAIRQNATYEKVMENMHYFEKIAKEKQTLLNLAVCPMTLNWQEIPSIVQYCNEKEIIVYFNTVWNPANLTLSRLPSAELDAIIKFNESIQWNVNTSLEINNVAAFTSYTNQLKKWLEAIQQKEAKVLAYQQKIAIKKKNLEGNPIFRAMYKLQNRVDIKEVLDQYILQKAAEEAESADAFIIAYFETLCEVINAYSEEPDELLTEIRKSNALTLFEQLLTQISAKEISNRIIYNNHRTTALYIINMKIDEKIDPDLVFEYSKTVH